MNESDLMGQLQSLLSDPSMAQKLKSALESLGEPMSVTPPVEEFSLTDTADKLKQAYQGLNNTSDPRVSLLNALKPYMNQNRASHLDTAVRLLGFTKMSGFLKNFQ